MSRIWPYGFTRTAQQLSTQNPSYHLQKSSVPTDLMDILMERVWLPHNRPCYYPSSSALFASCAILPRYLSSRCFLGFLSVWRTWRRCTASLPLALAGHRLILYKGPCIQRPRILEPRPSFIQCNGIQASYPASCYLQTYFTYESAISCTGFTSQDSDKLISVRSNRSSGVYLYTLDRIPP